MSTIKQLENFIQYCTAKNQVISKNIANVGTKNYNREDVTFKDILAGEQTPKITSNNKKHLNISAAGTSPFDITVDNSGDDKSGVNNVDIEMEMATLAENTINFKFASKKISSYYETLRSVINGGGR